MIPKILYTTIQNPADWQRLTSGRDNTRWFLDPDCTRRASEADADEAGDDIYTDAGWNTAPVTYPTLAHIEI